VSDATVRKAERAGTTAAIFISRRRSGLRNPYQNHPLTLRMAKCPCGKPLIHSDEPLCRECCDCSLKPTNFNITCYYSAASPILEHWEDGGQMCVCHESD